MLPDLPDIAELGNTALPAATPRALSRKQKAAIIVRLLLSEGVELKLADLPDAMQTELAHQMSTMRFVDRVTLKSVIDEFVEEIEAVGLSFPGGLEGALSVLDGTISPATVARIRKAKGFNFSGDPWETIAGLDPNSLLPVLEEESTEVAAVLLSKLKVSTAAALLGQIPGPRARKLAYAISLTGGVAPEVVDRIGRAVVERLDAQPSRAFADGPVERVGAILNFAPGATRDDVLTGLDEEDAAFAEEVRKAIFTFANIPERIDARDIPKITRDVDQAVLITALAGATGPLQKAAEFILENISKRMADQIREEMANVGKVKDKDAEEAMNTIVSAIRELEAAGEILLLSGDEE
ncbi:flagellar motor switch protein FliG [Maritimibacter dapengensis]|uniref:Flagellar motor switch protein FliG n=1 Tax=Maritimibacter dapengensis TaxID=2836868 RepID=A0ABS6T1V5_9RHOB|nr:FliG C-terminal domain-containing protein [Maritimibacter dapengensis]MBV7378362.1 flagellar motor switch protein FliG [Maritimibacter dapengensis]